MSEELPKSATRLSFEKSVRDKNWYQAYRDFNFMNLYEMLRAYRYLDPPIRTLFWDQRERTTRVPGQPGAGCNPGTPDRDVPNTTAGERPRMKYAVDIVDAQQMPDGDPPGDLRGTGQEEDAREFLAPVPPKFASLTFNQLNGAYPRGTPENVKRTIGGKVNADWIENTCAIRVSRVLNAVGFFIPGPSGPLSVVSGADKRWYAYRQLQLQGWIETQFGAPSVIFTKPGERIPIDRRNLLNLQGLIGFEIPFSNATGHIDLWDGEHFGTEAEATHDYFAMAKAVKFWRVPSWRKA